MSNSIRVLIVDDSVVQREAIKMVLSTDPQFKIVGEATNGAEAIVLNEQLSPDVITMDMIMPVVGGLKATEIIMSKNPTPIVIVSSEPKEDIVTALTMGAMDCISTSRIFDIVDEVVDKVKRASRVKAVRHVIVDRNKIGLPRTSSVTPEKPSTVVNLVVLGISTGGPETLAKLLPRLNNWSNAAMLIVQHMTKGFISGMGKQLDRISHLDVGIAADREQLKPGMIRFAPDINHLTVNKNGVLFLMPDKNASLHVPSADELFLSAADSFGSRAIGVLMTGMGQDGLIGMRRIKEQGGTTIAQNRESSIVYGMNRSAIEDGIVDYVLSIEEIATHLNTLLER